MKGYKAVNTSSETEFIEKRSRFIGRCYPVESEEQALEILSDIRKKHWDATHNCFAYRIGEMAATARFSDDGEPGGTAGMPIMEVLRAKELTNTLIIVTRYFGGILLGAGGLVRAYSKSAADAVAEAGTAHYIPAKLVSAALDYSRFGAMESFFRTAAQVQDIQYAENVTVYLAVSAERCDGFIADVIERSDGRCTPEVTGETLLKVVE